MSESKSKGPAQTFEEAKYLRHLIENEIPVRIRLSNNDEVQDMVEFFRRELHSHHPPERAQSFPLQTRH